MDKQEPPDEIKAYEPSRSNYSRGSGILMHISSLPSKYGIGAFGEAAYRFVDFLAACGQKYWQILPLGMTGYGNSPYQSCSAFAGNIYFIDLDILAQQGLLSADDYQGIDWGGCRDRVDYNKIYINRAGVLKKAAASFDGGSDYVKFCEINGFWLDDFALFMAIKEHHGMQGMDKWGEAFRVRDRETLEHFAESHKSEIEFYKIAQYWFFSQLDSLKRYANEHGISIIGDIPFYIAYDSTDVWAAPELFDLDENLMPRSVAGVPPDAFSDDGQLWGNPLYDYERMRADGYGWWRRRIAQCFKQCDILRIDHFRAIDSYYAVPYPSENAKNGEWRKGEGIHFIQALGLTDRNIIAEDLGDLGESVRALVRQTGFPNMKVLEFAFDSGPRNEFLPHNYNENCVVYTGTHDNNTVRGWYRVLPLKERLALLGHVPGSAFMKKSRALIKYAQQSRAAIAIIPMQDYLDLDDTARMNLPSTITGNWEWRITDKELTSELAGYIKRLSRQDGKASRAEQ